MWKKPIESWLSKNQFGLKFLKKTVIPSLLGLGLTFSVAFASESQLATIYHVYIDGKHMGIVENKETIETYVDQIIEQREQIYTSYTFSIDEDISYVAEKVFNPNTSSNDKVLAKLDEELSVVVNAYEVKIGDKLFGYFKDKETAEKTIESLKTKYVDRQILADLEANPEVSTANIQQVDSKKINESSKVKDVQFSEKVSFSSEKVSTSKILTEEQGKRLLEKGTLEDEIHLVQEGEVLGVIANKYNLDLKTILELNPTLKEDSILQIGQKINVTDYQPFLDVIVVQEEVVEEQIDYKKVIIESDEMYKGESKVKQKGSNGTKKVNYEIEKVNGQVVSKKVLSEQIIKDSVDEIIIQGTKVIPSRGTGDFSWPTVGGKITSHVGYRWGSYHKGIDIAGVSNRSILAADNGVIESAGWGNDGYGNKIIINHNNGYKTLYAHMSAVNVKVGETVVKGSKIGTMGSTGHSTGTHLHFEVYKNGSVVNPTSLY